MSMEGQFLYGGGPMQPETEKDKKERGSPELREALDVIAHLPRQKQSEQPQKAYFHIHYDKTKKEYVMDEPQKEQQQPILTCKTCGWNPDDDIGCKQECGGRDEHNAKVKQQPKDDKDSDLYKFLFDLAWCPWCGEELTKHAHDCSYCKQRVSCPGELSEPAIDLIMKYLKDKVR